eukprot:scaffold43125_cov71-Cyclotella_meneghiniana.AAC.3
MVSTAVINPPIDCHYNGRQRSPQFCVNTVNPDRFTMQNLRGWIHRNIQYVTPLPELAVDNTFRILSKACRRHPPGQAMLIKTDASSSEIRPDGLIQCGIINTTTRASFPSTTHY